MTVSFHFPSGSPDGVGIVAPEKSRRRPSFRLMALEIGFFAAVAIPLGYFATDADAAQFVARQSDRPLEFTLPLYGTTMVSVPDDPIKTAVFDRATVDIQTDSRSGMLYVLPKTEGSAMVYVTCRSGDTAALYLTFDPEASPRTIVLEKKGGRTAPDESLSAAPVRALRAEGFSAEVKRFVTLILRHESGDEAVRTAETVPGPAAEAALRQLQPLNVRIDAVWRSNEARALEVTVRNGTIMPVDIDPEALTSGALWAVAATQTRLAPGERTTMILVEAARD